MTCNMLGFLQVLLSGFNFESNALSKSGTKSCTESIKGIMLLLPQRYTGWWFQPTGKIFDKLGIFPNFRGENQKCLKSPQRYKCGKWV